MAEARWRGAPPQARITPAMWAELRDEPPPADADPAAEYFPPPGALSLREAWVLVRGDILEHWCAERPGTRPSCWWNYDSPEPRRRLGGTGDRLSEVLAHGSCFSYGLPAEGWLTPSLVAVYRSHLNIALRNRLHGRVAQPVDTRDPPRFESEPDYLARLGLLTSTEQALFEAGELDTTPETVASKDAS